LDGRERESGVVSMDDDDVDGVKVQEVQELR
jgi:hypothetical protein